MLITATSCPSPLLQTRSYVWGFTSGMPEVKPQVEIKSELNTESQRKKKRSREDKFEKAMNLFVDKVSRASKESDEMFVKLEGKRMKLEECMM